MGRVSREEGGEKEERGKRERLGVRIRNIADSGQIPKAALIVIGAGAARVGVGSEGEIRNTGSAGRTEANRRRMGSPLPCLEESNRQLGRGPCRGLHPQKDPSSANRCPTETLVGSWNWNWRGNEGSSRPWVGFDCQLFHRKAAG